MRAKESDGVLQAAVMLRSGVWLQSYGLCDGECVSDRIHTSRCMATGSCVYCNKYIDSSVVPDVWCTCCFGAGCVCCGSVECICGCC